MITYYLPPWRLIMLTTSESSGIVNELLQEVSTQLADYIGNCLPVVHADENWWDTYVLSYLSYNQREWIAPSDNENLHSLDLSSLLKVLDGNWFDFQQRFNLSREDRHYAKEMQTIRNRWAHIPPEGYCSDDIYRDLDTIHRFCRTIRATTPLLDKAMEAKQAILASTIEPSTQERQKPTNLVQQPNPNQIVLGDIVQLKSDTSVQGAVVSIIQGGHENRYQVFANNEMKVLYESQISKVLRIAATPTNTQVDEFLSFLTAQQISNPSLSALYSLNTARIDFIPYQLRPVIKFIRSDRPRMLIADGVGVGKTIEAGLILREIQARRDVRSIMIICPKPLVAEKKWEMEMKRFEETFMPLDGSLLRYCMKELNLEGEWPDAYQKCILPYSLLDETLLFGTKQGKKQRTPGLINMSPPPKFDLIIVDEAHHIRNSGTYAHQVVDYLVKNAEAALFLTATPIQMGNKDLYVLLNLLRPDLVIDRDTFEHMVEPNPFINEAVVSIRTQKENWQKSAISSLGSAAETNWGRSILKENPEFKEIIELLQTKEISQETRIRLITQTENLNSLSGIINRTRRRDIGDFTLRDPYTIEVAFTQFQQEIHDEVLAIQATKMSLLHGDGMIRFLLSTIRRQVSSCLFGLAPFLQDILSRHMEELGSLDDEEAFDTDESTFVQELDDRIKMLLKKVETLPPEDPKFDRLLDIIKKRQKLVNNKTMIFSSFIHTLTYLHKKLGRESVRMGLIKGATEDEERLKLRNRFSLPKEDPDAIDILLFSEVGSEGLDYQFCDCMINYDLPWNPMRIEQRIGRIDRNGQKSEKVSIYNFITPGTIDAEIYERCMLRIGVFSSSLGASEQILGEITHEIQNIANDYTLNPSMRQEKLQQLADNKIRLIQEEEALEKKQMELFGISLPREQMKKDIEDATSIWLSSSSLQRLVINYLKCRCGDDQEYILGEKGLKTLRLNQEARAILHSDFKSLSRQKSPMYKNWEQYLTGANPHATITFEAEVAKTNNNAMLLMPIHPLVKQAALHSKLEKGMLTMVKVQSNEVSHGSYPFAIYLWKYSGLIEDMVFQPVTENDELQSHLFTLLNASEDIPFSENMLSLLDKEQLDQKHYKEWDRARKAHTEKSIANAEYKRESLSTSYNAQIRLLEAQLQSSNDEKIQRMRQAQITTATNDYQTRIAKLEMDMKKADIEADPIAYGIIQIEEEVYELR